VIHNILLCSLPFIFVIILLGSFPVNWHCSECISRPVITICLGDVDSCRCWDFGLTEVVKDMWSNSDFRKSWCSEIDYKDPATFHGSKAYRQTEEDCGGLLRHGRQPVAGGPLHETMHLQLGCDGLNMHIFGCYSAQVCGVRCEDLHADDAYTRKAWRVLYIVEGPKECTNHNQILQPTINAAIRYSPALREGEPTDYKPCLPAKVTHLVKIRQL
jgi:hypothetical protein